MGVEEGQPRLRRVHGAPGDKGVVLGGAGEAVHLGLGGDARPRIAFELRAQLRHDRTGGFAERDDEHGDEHDEERGAPHADAVDPERGRSLTLPARVDERPPECQGAHRLKSWVTEGEVVDQKSRLPILLRRTP